MIRTSFDALPMLATYMIKDQRLTGADAQRQHPVWFDLLEPTADEDASVEAALGIAIPTQQDMAEIETTSRLYREDGAVFMTATVIHGTEGGAAELHPITFILTPRNLVTVRYSRPGVFAAFVAHPDLPDLASERDRIFAGLVEAVIDKTADICERLATRMDAISADVFREAPPSEKDLEALLRKIGRGGDLNSKLRESIVSLGRLINFMSAECRTDNQALRDRLEAMASDVRSLADHSTFLSGKIEFLLEATLGFINIEQNNIMRIMSVVAVVITPPTLIASIYGMNFEIMPELRWPFGYPFALGLMIASAVLPYLFFRRRGWL